jgi:hypothetical protein
MRKLCWACILAAMLFAPASGYAADSPFGSGSIDRSLKYEDFKIDKNGYATGYIVNTSNSARRDVQLDMWTTDTQNTRIFWQKTIHIDEIPARGRYLVKEPYKSKGENPARTLFMFRLHNSASYKNKLDANIR